MSQAPEVEEPVDKQVLDAKGFSRGAADKYLAGGFCEREGKHIAYMVLFFGT